ncbi:hypothetical protein H3V53_03725 [Paraburkholderia bengalensis]|uniref:Proteophosphoglycan ppg4 n=1 Tax=Paraburkholderia bengalensis TaxID=2747562 RepID=A0ABU8ILF5_9BURK
MKASSTLVAAAAALALSGGAFAQANNTLATPSTRSPVVNAASGYGTPAASNSDSGMSAGSPNSNAQKGANGSPTPATTAFGVNNTLATPSTASPVK